MSIFMHVFGRMCYTVDSRRYEIMKGGTRMGKTIRVRINSTARTTSSGNIQVRTTVNNGHSTRTTTKTIRVK